MSSSCKSGSSRSLTTRSGYTFYVKPNEPSPCLSTTPSKLCAQKGSRANPVFFDEIPDLIHDIDVEKKIILRLVEDGVFGTLDRIYNWGQRIIQIMGEDNASQILQGAQSIGEEEAVPNVSMGHVSTHLHPSLRISNVSLTNISVEPPLIYAIDSDLELLYVHMYSKGTGIKWTNQKVASGGSCSFVLTGSLIKTKSGACLQIDTRADSVSNLTFRRSSWTTANGQLLNMTASGDSIIEIIEKDITKKQTGQGQGYNASIEVTLSENALLRRSSTNNISTVILSDAMSYVLTTISDNATYSNVSVGSNNSITGEGGVTTGFKKIISGNGTYRSQSSSRSINVDEIRRIKEILVRDMASADYNLSSTNVIVGNSSSRIITNNNATADGSWLISSTLQDNASMTGTLTNIKANIGLIKGTVENTSTSLITVSTGDIRCDIVDVLVDVSGPLNVNISNSILTTGSGTGNPFNLKNNAHVRVTGSSIDTKTGDNVFMLSDSKFTMANSAVICDDAEAFTTINGNSNAQISNSQISLGPNSALGSGGNGTIQPSAQLYISGSSVSGGALKIIKDIGNVRLGTNFSIVEDGQQIVGCGNIRYTHDTFTIP